MSRPRSKTSAASVSLCLCRALTGSQALCAVVNINVLAVVVEVIFEVIFEIVVDVVDVVVDVVDVVVKVVVVVIVLAVALQQSGLNGTALSGLIC